MASNVHLLNCSGVVVNADVENFIGIGLTNVVRDYAYSNMVEIGQTIISRDASSLLAYDANATYAIKVYFVDTGAGNVTLTIDPMAFQGMTLIFKCINDPHDFILAETTGVATIDGAAMPYTTGMVLNDSMWVYCDGTNFYII